MSKKDDDVDVAMNEVKRSVWRCFAWLEVVDCSETLPMDEAGLRMLLKPWLEKHATASEIATYAASLYKQKLRSKEALARVTDSQFEKMGFPVGDYNIIKQRVSGFSSASLFHSYCLCTLLLLARARLILCSFRSPISVQALHRMVVRRPRL